ncbi:golgin-45-like [Amphibalanus amphitrite]|uniref:golgin-45-like n=1 Tax=Amphibalanus amphitrite TaxID=1232801 RepID=UPI001C919F70|nr:golgin-45-like [Amphibalanus amphitrite]
MAATLSPPRTSGDGMESAVSNRPADCPLLEPVEQQMLKIITDQRLQGASLSDILGDLELASGVDQPIFRLAPAIEQRSAAHHPASRTTAVPASPTSPSGGAREARFVPYEPYPGCTSPLTAGAAEAGSRPVESGPRRVSGESDGSAPSVAAVAAAAAASAAPVAPEEEDVRITKLRREKDELQRELNVAMEVTAELKKLLVASIGEDIESRLHLLTEDKAHLAQLVRTFSAQAAQEGEGRDQLSIQCDVWRSKFMACSLMVDELAGWKAVLGRRCRESEAALKALLEERRQIADQLRASARSLTAVRDAFDPLVAQSGRGSPDGDAVQLAERVTQLSGALHERLLGRPPAPAPAPGQGQTEESAQTHVQTPAEEAAEKLLSTSACYQYQAQRDSCRDRGMADRFHPQARLEHLTMTCCTHCSGDIYVV